MATSLYETLEIPNDASPEQIRKAYKRKALETHPDRLPPTATLAEKQDSEERFRKVNNAYEILNDPQNRKVYDRHGVFPPPEYQPEPSSHHSARRHRSPPRRNQYSDQYSDPFYDHGFHFTDPFELFDSIFGDFNRHFSERSSWPEGPSSRFHSRFGSMMAAMERDMFSDFGPPGAGFPSRSLLFPSPFSASFPNFPSISAAPEGRGGFVSEGFYSQTINGVTHAVHKRREWDGTEHEIRTYPDGRKVHTVNGIEQNTNSHSNLLPPPPPPPPLESRNAPVQGQNNSYLPLPPPSYHSVTPVPPQPTKYHRNHRNNHSFDDYNRSGPSTGFIPPPVNPDSNWHHDDSGPGFATPHQESKWHRVRNRTHSESPVPRYDEGPVIPHDHHSKRHHWWSRN